MKLIKILALTAAFSFLLIARGMASPTPEGSIRAFVSATNQAKYKTAYSYISKPLQEELSFEEFLEAAARVKKLRLVSMALLSQTSRISKARVTVESLEKQDRGTWERRKRTGDLVFILEQGEWRVIQLDIKGFKKMTKADRR